MRSRSPLEECVIESLEAYFRDLNGTEPHGIHGMVMQTVEKPLLQTVMQRAGDNQSVAAQWLGINRNTLRKKLKDHKLIK